MKLIKAEEAKRITDVNNHEHKDEIEILNTLIKNAADRGMRTCEVNIKLIPSVLDELDNAGYAIYGIGDGDEGEKIYYILRW